MTFISQTFGFLRSLHLSIAYFLEVERLVPCLSTDMKKQI